jgi:predicted HTH domain antitoxin
MDDRTTMHTHALTTALTLYRSGTLSLTQAAHRAGCSEREMIHALGKHGIAIRESFASHTSPDNTPARAD